MRSKLFKIWPAIFLYCFHTVIGVLCIFVLYFFWALAHLFMEKNVHENYLGFSKSILWQPVMHSWVHFSISFTLHSRVHLCINFSLHSQVNISISFTLHSWVHFSINFTLHSRVHFSICFTLHSRVHFSISFTLHSRYMSA